MLFPPSIHASKKLKVAWVIACMKEEKMEGLTSMATDNNLNQNE